MTLREFINSYDSFKINLIEVNYDIEKKLCKQYSIIGTPTLLFYSHGKLVGRHFGEITYQDLETIIQNVVESQK